MRGTDSNLSNPRQLSINITERILNADLEDWIGVLTWAAVVAITIYLDMAYPKLEMPPKSIYIGLFIGYLAGYLLAIAAITENVRLQAIGLGAMLCFSFLLGWQVQLDYLPILTIIWAAVVAYYLPFRWSVVTVLAVVFAWFVMMSIRTDQALVVQGILYATFHIFSVLLASSNVKVNRYATELKQKNNELVATQYLLSEASKDSERNRIARDIHDVVGHHLTALSIKLQVLSKTTEGDIKEEIDSCHHISKLLLSDVRAAVSELKELKDLDFREALSLLTSGLPGLHVNIEIDDGLLLNKIEIAEPLLKVIQESMTNSIRHGKATEFNIRIGRVGSNLNMILSDNGNVTQPNWKEGNGLTGIRERVSGLDGQVNYSLTEQGFTTTVILKDYKDGSH